jgi:nucleoside-diphosphate-sugar epimerase
LKRSFSNISRIETSLKKVKFYDIDQIDLENVFIENNIKCIIHTATCYGRKNEMLSEIVDANLNFPLRLLELGIKYNTDTFFNTDTQACDYLNFYTLSKKQFLEWLTIESKKGNIQGINFKLEHMYGIGDDDNKFVIWLIKKVIEDKEDIKLTGGEQERDFIYIDDVINAFLLVLDKRKNLPTFENFDIGTGNQVKLKVFIMKVFTEITKIKKINHELLFGVIPYRDNEPMSVNVDISKIKNIGWTPKTSLVTGLENTINFVKENII